MITIKNKPHLFCRRNKLFLSSVLLSFLLLTACGSSRQTSNSTDRSSDDVSTQSAGLRQTSVEKMPVYLPSIKRADQLEVELQHPLVSYTYTTEVESDGSLSLPGFEKLQVLGMTARALEELLAAKSRQVNLSSAWSKTVHESSENLVTTSLESLQVDTVAGSNLFNPRVRIVNYQISVLGLVERPGQYPVPQQHITIFEALALAGYKTTNTKHGTIKVLREANDGQLTFYTLHLDDKSIVNSPAYYLEQNDVLYVHPTRTGKWAAGLSSPAALGVTSLVSLLISVATLVVHIVKP